MLKELLKYGAEFRRALANFHYEVMDDGQILFTRQKLIVGGYMTHDVNGRDVRVDPNLVVNEGLNDLLGVYLSDDTQTLTWYLAPFSGNVTPAASWTAANFTANSTEFTNYDEATRQAWVEGGQSGQSISNLASKAAFTTGVGGGTVYGAGLLSASAKSAVTGKLFAASRFSASRVLSEDDILNVGYTVNATSS